MCCVVINFIELLLCYMNVHKLIHEILPVKPILSLFSIVKIETLGFTVPLAPIHLKLCCVLNIYRLEKLMYIK
jgi:hypothetical protein